MQDFFTALRQSLEANSRRLKAGKAFLPEYLKQRKLVNECFPPVARMVAKKLNLPLKEQVSNSFPEEWKIWKRQIVDHVLGNPKHPHYHFELESLDRAQLYLFLPGGRRDASKLWHYWGTVCKRLSGNKAMPRYFVFLLILPDEPVGSMPLWDIAYSKLFDPKVRPIIQNNPFSFYDRMIKTSARLFLNKKDWLINKDGEWFKARLIDYQHLCELVIITATGRQLVMSRGRDGFDPAKEQTVLLRWSTRQRSSVS